MSTSPTPSKRRLRLMNEVLPTPVRHEDSGRPNPRARTLHRLKVLAAFGAGIAACGKTTDDGTDGGVLVSRPDGGREPYGVVDPLPRPSCFKVQPTATARYLSGPRDAGADAAPADYDAGDGYRYIELEVAITEPDVAVGSISGSYPGQILEQEVTGGRVRLVLEIRPDLDGATVRIEASCALGPSTITVQAVLRGADIDVDVNGY